MEIFDRVGVNQNEVEKLRKIFLQLFRSRANFGAKEKVELQTFVLEGHPNPISEAKMVGKVENRRPFLAK